jgi:hypothetical protein
MFPLLFPYGSARISLASRETLADDQIRQILYLHTTGVWGDIPQNTRDTNLFQLKNKAGTIKSLHSINDHVFIVATNLDVGPSLYARDTLAYVAFDSDQETWTRSSFPDYNLTFISLAEYNEVLNSFLAPDPLGSYYILNAV